MVSSILSRQQCFILLSGSRIVHVEDRHARCMVHGVTGVLGQFAAANVVLKNVLERDNVTIQSQLIMEIFALDKAPKDNRATTVHVLVSQNY